MPTSYQQRCQLGCRQVAPIFQKESGVLWWSNDFPYALESFLIVPRGEVFSSFLNQEYDLLIFKICSEKTSGHLRGQLETSPLYSFPNQSISGRPASEAKNLGSFQTITVLVRGRLGGVYVGGMCALLCALLFWPTAGQCSGQ